MTKATWRSGRGLAIGWHATFSRVEFTASCYDSAAMDPLHSAATRPSSFAVSGFDQAREAAKVRLGQVAKGINPRAERLRLKAEKDRERAEAALSFEALVDEWSQLHLAHRRKRYREERRSA